MVGGVVFGSGGVIIVVGMMVPGDGCGKGRPGVIRGVAGVDTMGGMIVPVTGGGEGTGMLTSTGGTNGTPGGVEVTVGPDAFTPGPEIMGTPEPPATPPGDAVVIRGGVVPAGAGVNAAAGPA